MYRSAMTNWKMYKFVFNIFICLKISGITSERHPKSIAIVLNEEQFDWMEELTPKMRCHTHIRHLTKKWKFFSSFWLDHWQRGYSLYVYLMNRCCTQNKKFHETNDAYFHLFFFSFSIQSWRSIGIVSLIFFLGHLMLSTVQSISIVPNHISTQAYVRHMPTTHKCHFGEFFFLLATEYTEIKWAQCDYVFFKVYFLVTEPVGI